MTLTSSASLHLMRSVCVCVCFVAFIQSAHLNFRSTSIASFVRLIVRSYNAHIYTLDNDAVVWRLTDDKKIDITHIVLCFLVVFLPSKRTFSIICQIETCTRVLKNWNSTSSKFASGETIMRSLIILSRMTWPQCWGAMTRYFERPFLIYLFQNNLPSLLAHFMEKNTRQQRSRQNSKNLTDKWIVELINSATMAYWMWL